MSSSETKTEYEVLVFDLDGTLLDKDCKVTDQTQAAVKKAREAGTRVVLASGRHHAMIQPYAKQLELDTPIICCNGGYILDSEGQTVGEAKTLDPAVFNDLLAILDAKGALATLFTQNGIFATYRQEYVQLLEKEITQLPSRPPHPIHIYDRDKGFPEEAGLVVKILAYCPDEEKARELREELSSSFSDHTVAMSRSGFFDITLAGATKGNALASLLQDWNISPEQVAAFGDGENDLEMLNLAGHAVAIEHGSEKLKAVADHILDNSEPDAIARYLGALIH